MLESNYFKMEKKRIKVVSDTGVAIENFATVGAVREWINSEIFEDNFTFEARTHSDYDSSDGNCEVDIYSFREETDEEYVDRFNGEQARQARFEATQKGKRYDQWLKLQEEFGETND